MTRRFHPLVAATDCSGQAQPGTAALMLTVLDLYPKTQDWGIYNCRPVRGGSTLSHHAEGRAGDPGIPLVDGRANTAVGDPIVAALLANAWELGLDHLIYNGVVYSAANPNGAHYGGSTPTIRHEDHIHFGQAWTAARSLTETQAKAILGGHMPHSHQVTHKSPEKDWGDDPWAWFIETGFTTYPPSRTWEARREDNAYQFKHFYDSVIRPMQLQIATLQAEVASLKSGTGSHNHDTVYVKRGSTVRLP